MASYHHVRVIEDLNGRPGLPRLFFNREWPDSDGHCKVGRSRGRLLAARLLAASLRHAVLSAAPRLCTPAASWWEGRQAVSSLHKCWPVLRLLRDLGAVGRHESWSRLWRRRVALRR